MFKNTIQVPVQADPAKNFDEEKFKLILADNDLMHQMRRYILTLNHLSEITLADFTIPPEVSEYAQNIFIEVRK
jgi:hypothetical protein